MTPKDFIGGIRIRLAVFAFIKIVACYTSMQSEAGDRKSVV